MIIKINSWKWSSEFDSCNPLPAVADQRVECRVSLFSFFLNFWLNLKATNMKFHIHKLHKYNVLKCEFQKDLIANIKVIPFEICWLSSSSMWTQTWQNRWLFMMFAFNWKSSGECVLVSRITHTPRGAGYFYFHFHFCIFCKWIEFQVCNNVLHRLCLA